MEDILLNYGPALGIVLTILAGGWAMLKKLAKLIEVSNLNEAVALIKNDNDGIKSDFKKLKDDLQANRQELRELRKLYTELIEYVRKVKE